MNANRARVLTLLVAVVYGAICLCVVASAEEPEAIKIVQASSPPVIDGNLDEACWAKATLVKVQYPYASAGKITSPPPMIARLLWDDHYLYLGYSVTDDDLVAIGTGREIGPPDNRRPTSEEYLPEKNLDLVEFFVSFGDKQKFWEVHHTAANHLNNHWCEVPDKALAPNAKPTINDLTIVRDRFIPDDGKFTVARAAWLKPKSDGQPSTVNQPEDRDTGYSSELRLPWAGIGAPSERRQSDGAYAMSGMRLMILAAVLNGHKGEPGYHSSAIDLPTRMFHFSADRWPRYELTEK